MASPPKITDRVVNDLVHYVTRGVAIKYAAPAVGIKPQTFYVWMAKGEQDQENGEDTLHSRLYDTISKAKSKFIEEAIENIKKAGRTNKNWQANTWLLERLYAAAYGREAEEVQRLAKDIEQIKEILGAGADPLSLHNSGE